MYLGGKFNLFSRATQSLTKVESSIILMIILESLDISHCFNVNLEGSLEKRCKEHIKYLRLPLKTLITINLKLNFIMDHILKTTHQSFQTQFYCVTLILMITIMTFNIFETFRHKRHVLRVTLG